MLSYTGFKTESSAEVLPASPDLSLKLPNISPEPTSTPSYQTPQIPHGEHAPFLEVLI